MLMLVIHLFTSKRLQQGALVCAIFAVALATPASLFAHAGENHDAGITIVADELADESADEPGPIKNAPVSSAENSSPQNNLPGNIASIGGPFSLVNHLGESVTEQTYAGKHMLVFFGYSNCQIMCSISLKRIADALDILQSDADAPLSKLNPLVITVDPANDNPTRLRESLSTYHPALIGLTGTLDQLKPVYKAYGQKPSVLDMALSNNPVVSHTSYFYLMGPDGKLQTFFPPVLNSESMTRVIKKYLPI